MHRALSSNRYIVKQLPAVFRLTVNFDVLDPDNPFNVLMQAREDIGFLVKIMRMTDLRHNSPFNVTVRTPDGQQVLRVARGFSLFLSKVDVFDEKDAPLGGLKQTFGLRRNFNLLDANGMVLCHFTGSFGTWNFKFHTDDNWQVAEAARQLPGLQALLGADQYGLRISDNLAATNPLRALIMAAVLCVDLVFKEMA